MSAKAVLLFALKIAFAAAAVYLLLRNVDLAETKNTLSNIAPGPIAGAIALALSAQMLGAVRWGYCLGSTGLRRSWGWVVSRFFAASFVGTLLPAGIGRDAFLVWYSGREPHGSSNRWLPATAAVAIDRVVGLAVLALCCIPAGIVIAGGRPATDSCPMIPSILPLPWALAASAAGCTLLVLATIAFRHRLDTLMQRVGITPGTVLRPSWLIAVTGISLATVAAVVAAAWSLGIGLGMKAPASEYILYLPLIALLIQLPITIFGIGVREAGFLILFACSTDSREDVLALSIAFFAVSLIVNLAGGVLYLLAGDPRSTAAQNDTSVTGLDR